MSWNGNYTSFKNMHVSIHGFTYAQSGTACSRFLSANWIATPNRRNVNFAMAFAVGLREELL